MKQIFMILTLVLAASFSSISGFANNSIRALSDSCPKLSGNYSTCETNGTPIEGQSIVVTQSNVDNLQTYVLKINTPDSDPFELKLNADGYPRIENGSERIDVTATTCEAGILISKIGRYSKDGKLQLQLTSRISINQNRELRIEESAEGCGESEIVNCRQ